MHTTDPRAAGLRDDRSLRLPDLPSRLAFILHQGRGRLICQQSLPARCYSGARSTKFPAALTEILAGIDSTHQLGSTRLEHFGGPLNQPW